MNSPPVAPAAVVVLQEEEGHGGMMPPGSSSSNSNNNNNLSSYPVATFVRDWVRTSLDHITERTAVTAGFAGSGCIGEPETLPLSVRSEADLPVPADFAPAPGGDGQSSVLSQQRNSGGFPDDRADDTMFQEEYILVDGDLIAIPPQAPNHAEQEMLEDMVRSQLQLESNSALTKSCQPRKMRRGVRKLARLFKRGNRKGANKDASLLSTTFSDQDGVQTQQQQREANNLPIELSCCIDNTVNASLQQQHEHAAASPAAAGLFATTGLSAAPSSLAVPDEKSNSSGGKVISPKRKPKKEKEKKPRAVWGRGRRSNPSSATELLDDSFLNRSGAFSTGTGGQGSSVEQPPHESYDNEHTATMRMMMRQANLEERSGISATTGLEPPSTTAAQQQRGDMWSFAAAANAGGLDGLVATTTTTTNSSHDGLLLLRSPPPPIIMRRPIDHESSPGSSGGRTTSVTASYVGTADLLAFGGGGGGVIFPDASVAAESFVEEDLYDIALMKKEDPETYQMPLSLIAETADIKVDKADTPDVEAMLRRAVIETSTDLEAPPDSDCLPTNQSIPADFCYSMSPGCGFGKHAGKSDGSTIPLSQAMPHHAEVHNDTLKVVMVSASSVDKSWLAGRLRCSNKRPRKRTTLAVDVHEWRPYLPSESASAHGEPNQSPVKCMIWDVQGASPTVGSTAESRSNFGAHPATQSLFFSPQSLYLLCWDLGCNNPKTNRIAAYRDLDEEDSDFDDDEDEDEYQDDFIREEANRQADRALHADIANRVLTWFDCIARSGPKSAILPVALVPEGMSEAEVKRRCDMMRVVLEDHFHRAYENGLAPKLLITGTENSILCVNNFGNGEGIQKLQEMMVAIANDPSNSVFDHVGTPVPPGTVLVREAIQRFKEEHKLILLDHLLGDLGNALEVNVIIDALHFLANIGEILYFGTDEDEVLSRYIILSRKWLISALSCILRNDLKRELIETRRFMNMQCIYSDQKYDENEIMRALVSEKSSSCPLLSDEDAKMLWQSMSFMREASDRYSNLVERSTTVPTMFYFLERLLVHTGVFLPLGASHRNASLDQSEVFFVPSLLAQADPTNMWTYMTSESWMTTQCHSWLFRDGAPPNLMEHVAVRILRDLYEFSRKFQSTPQCPARESTPRAHSVPVGKTSFGEFVEGHKTEAVGTVRIHHVMCFKSSMLVKIGTVFADGKTGDLRESFVEVFVAVVDQTSAHSVASDVMRPCMQRVVVSGKGQAGRHGHKLWKGGYKLVLDSVRDSLVNMPNVDSQAICPECLATSSPRIASTWGWDVVLAAAESGNPHVICLRGHRVNSNLICGTCPDRKTAPFVDPHSSQRITKSLNIKEALPSVVLVGVWDPETKSIISVGSGFIVDKKAGLIVTAGHVLFNMEGGREKFGKPYFGYKGARAVIGVIPDKDGKHAVFRYFAEIVAHDIQNVDACVLQIRARMEKDVDGKDGVGAIDQPETTIGLDTMHVEELRSLKLTKHFDLAESVRLLGYSQEGEGIFEKGKHISPSVEFVEGLIRRHFKATMCDDSFDSDSSSTASNHSHHHQQQAFSPREEIVLQCLTNAGHSGGPCVNADGKVVGILSRSDPVERDRCYLVPTAEIRPLIIKAKSLCTPRPPRITSMQTI